MNLYFISFKFTLIYNFRKRCSNFDFVEEKLMNKIVIVIIDRPLGSYHPKHKDIYYSVNYGYVPNIIAPDGEEQDVYVLGVDEPIKEFIGEVVAIIHRTDDVEEKWVVVPQGIKITKEEIQEQVYFQEQYFNSFIEMLN